jgi:hypothetical protein
MSQVVAPGGILLGNGVFIFSGAGDPNARTDADMLVCSLGSLYLRTDVVNSSAQLYVLTTAPSPPTGAYVGAPGVWTPK